MYNFFGFNIYSKEEKEERRRKYADFIFPGGEKQRWEVRRKLRAGLPKLDGVLLMYFYVSVKEKIKRENISYEEAVKLLGKKAQPPRMKDSDRAFIKTVLEEDMKNEYDRYSESRDGEGYEGKGEGEKGRPFGDAYRS